MAADQPRWVVQSTLADDLSDEGVRHSLEYMLTIAAATRGLYDGFGAPVVSADGAGSSEQTPTESVVGGNE